MLLSSVTGKISNSEVLDSFDKSLSVPYASEHTQMLLDGQNILEHINPENALLTTDDDDVMKLAVDALASVTSSRVVASRCVALIALLICCEY